MRSGPAFDPQTGWLYVICQHKLMRIAVDKAIRDLDGRHYHVKMTGEIQFAVKKVSQMGAISLTYSDMTFGKDYLEVIDDFARLPQGSELMNTLVEWGWPGYRHHFTYGQALQFDSTHGVYRGVYASFV